jgi:hypothetical protein
MDGVPTRLTRRADVAAHTEAELTATCNGCSRMSIWVDELRTCTFLTR